ncbi:MAG: ABC transporter permease [Patescibacteria group bacterium]|jgi:putative ABC transport system permease protein
MTKLGLYFTEGINDLLKNKGRTFLTSLGIIIGVYSVVLLLSFGEGLKLYINQQFESLGTNLIYILPGKISGSSPSLLGGKKFTFSDYRKLRSLLNNSQVVPVTTKNVSIETPSKSESTSLMGSTVDFFGTRNLTLTEGRYFSRSDEASGRKVAVIGPKIAEKLFGNQNPVRKSVKIQGLRFLIIGVTEPKGGGGLGGPDIDNYVFIPYKTAWILTNDKSFLSFYIEPPDKESIPVVVEKATRLLLEKYKVDDFSVTTQDELIATISGIFTVVNSVLVGIAAISLLVGGIGITNIMFVTVSERTKEIGIRRAIGAQENNILLQFVTQSILLTTLGGTLALLLAFLTNLVINRFFPATITPIGMILAFGVSFVIGVVFGVLPARKAAKMTPVTAIRYE